MKLGKKFAVATLAVLSLLGVYGATWFIWLTCVNNSQRETQQEKYAAALNQMQTAQQISAPFQLVDFRHIYSKYSIALIYSMSGENGKSEKLFLELVPLYSGSTKPSMPTEAEVMYAYGSNYIIQYQPAKAIKPMLRTLELVKQTGKLDTEFGGNVLNTLGKSYRDQRLTKEARSYFDQALKVRSTKFGAESIPAYTTIYDTAYNSYVAGDYAESKRLFEQASAIAGKLPADESAHRVAASRNGIAACLLKLGDTKQAKEILAEFVKTDKKGFPHVSASYTVGRLGQIFDRQGRDQEAEGFYKDAVAINEITGQTTDPEFLEAATRYERLLERTGKTTEAADLRRRLQLRS